MNKYVPLLLTFTASLLLVALHARHFRPGALDLALVSLASYRLARIIAFEPVMHPIRAPCVGRPGVRGVIGEAMSCPLCASVWIAAGLTYGLVLLPQETRLVAFVFAAAGAAEFLNHVVSLVHVHQEIGLQQRDATTNAVDRWLAERR